MKISASRKQSIETHIKHDDYFGTLATVLDLHRQMLGKSAREQEIADALESIVADLLYLQDNHKIGLKRL